MTTNNSFSIQRVKAIVLKDTVYSFSFFWILIILYIFWLLNTAFTIAGRDYVLIGSEMARVYGIANRPTDGFFATVLMVTMVYTTYIKFSSKKFSRTYRLWPTTALEKCASIVCEYLLIIACCIILKIIFCLGFGLWNSGFQMGFDAIKYMFCSRPDGWGMALGNTPVDYSYDLENKMFSYGYWPMSKIGIPFDPSSPTNHTYNPICSQMSIYNWNAYPVLAMGLNIVDFLLKSLSIFLNIAMFSFIKPGKRFISSIGFKFIGILILYTVFAILFTQITGSRIVRIPLFMLATILQGAGPWCWMSMNGWMIQAVILLIYIALTIYYIYHKIKTI